MSLLNQKEVFKFTVHAKDGDVGKVKDILFDDITWQVRYLVTDTKKWLPSEKVLLSPESISMWDMGANKIYMNLTKEQIKNAPTVDQDPPVSRQEEERLSAFYGWPAYWSVPYNPSQATLGSRFSSAIPTREYPPEIEIALETRYHQGNANLRSVKEVHGYSVMTTSEEEGSVSGFLYDTHTGELPYVIINCGGWLNFDYATIPNFLIASLNWSRRTLRLSISKEILETAPRIPTENLAGTKEERLIRHYFESFNTPDNWGNYEHRSAGIL